jgi:probable HAF family extracellular repeat protein
MSRQVLLAMALGTLAVSGGCGGSEPAGPGDESPPVVPNAASVDVDPGLGLVTTLGSEIQFTATARDANGGPLAGKTFTWASSEPSVATVGADGLARGVAAGERHAFLWTTETGMRDLGTLGGEESRAFGVNSLGAVVGQGDAAGGEPHAFLWTADAGMVDLGTLWALWECGGATATTSTRGGMSWGTATPTPERPMRSCGPRRRAWSTLEPSAARSAGRVPSMTWARLSAQARRPLESRTRSFGPQKPEWWTWAPAAGSRTPDLPPM